MVSIQMLLTELLHMQVFCLYVYDVKCVILYIVTAVFFNQSTYSFMENDRTAEFILILSKPSSKDITVEVVNNDITAVGRY